MSTESESADATVAEDCESSNEQEIFHGTTYHKHIVEEDVFDLPSKYNSPLQRIGEGTNAIVCSGLNSDTGQRVAIKKISNTFNNRVNARRTLREIKIPLHMDHKNVIAIKDVIRPRRKEAFNDVYIVYELMDKDLTQILKSKQRLSDDHYQCFLCQILRGLKYIHSANVLHLDLKPTNLLVNTANYDLKIADFASARTVSETGFMTELVVTPRYRPPELFLSLATFTSAIDVWSVGCIFAEMVTRKPLFPTKNNNFDQLRTILELIGTPDESGMDFFETSIARERFRGLPKLPRQNFSAKFPSLKPEAIDLLEKMLVFDPRKRITVQEALSHPYLDYLHDEANEPVCSQPLSFDFEDKGLSEEVLKELVWRESVKFNPDPASSDSNKTEGR